MTRKQKVVRRCYTSWESLGRRNWQVRWVSRKLHSWVDWPLEADFFELTRSDAMNSRWLRQPIGRTMPAPRIIYTHHQPDGSDFAIGKVVNFMTYCSSLAHRVLFDIFAEWYFAPVTTGRKRIFSMVSKIINEDIFENHRPLRKMKRKMKL